jgi:CspA family cold shock protein
MRRGIIKFYNDRRGYGFIRSEENLSPREEIFVHYSQFRGVTAPREGQTVTFDVRDGDRGLEAVNVHLVS